MGFKLGSYGMAIITGILASYYFYIDNPHEPFKKAISAGIFIWIFATALNQEVIRGSLIVSLSAGILGYLYFLRFKAKEIKNLLDSIKLACVLALVPATYIPGVPIFLSAILIYIFLLDRLIINNNMKKTTQIIVFSVMCLICLTFLVYSFIKADEADKSRIEAENQFSERIRVEKESDALRKMALEAASEAKRQEAMALEQREVAEELKKALELCQSK